MSADDPSILDFSAYVRPPADALMVALRAYGDESGKENDPNTPIISMGTVMADSGQWALAEQKWNGLLSDYGIPYLHMVEVKGGKGDFKQFRKPQRLIRLLDDVANIILECGLVCGSVAVHRKDFQRICKEFDVETNLYYFTLYISCLMMGTIALNNRSSNPSLQIILDRIEKGTSLVAEAERLYCEDQHIAWRGWPLVSALSPQNPEGSKNFAGLQMADVIAWHSRNALLSRWEWFETVKPLLGENNYEVWNVSLDNWLMKRARSFTGDKADYIKFHRVFARLSHNERLKDSSYDYERLKNHIFLNRHKEPPYAARQEAINQCGRVFPLTP